MARLSITTKGALILRDVDLLRKIHERSSLSIQVSLISLSPELLRKLEPWAPPPAVRLEVLRRLATAGLDAGLSLAPILPALTDAESDIDELLARSAAFGVRRLTYNILWLRSPTREKYLRFLAEEFPAYREAYERAYAGRVYLGGPYRERIVERVERLREKHGLVSPPETGSRPRPRPTQLRLEI